MFKIRDKVQIDGDMFVRSILGLELQDDGQVYCWVDGMIEQVNVKHIHLVTPSDIQQDYSPGDRVCWAHEDSNAEFIVKTAEIGLNLETQTIHQVYDLIHESGALSYNVSQDRLQHVKPYTLF